VAALVPKLPLGYPTPHAGSVAQALRRPGDRWAIYLAPDEPPPAAPPPPCEPPP
jgi:hypothetical protein